MVIKTLVSGTCIIVWAKKQQFLGDFIKKRNQDIDKPFKTDEDY